MISSGFDYRWHSCWAPARKETDRRWEPETALHEGGKKDGDRAGKEREKKFQAQGTQTNKRHPRADDLISEDNETVQLALKRLSPKENYDRVYRLRRAAQLSLSHTLLPKSQWTKPEEDVPYILPLIKAIEAEAKEKAALDSMAVIKSH